MSQVKVIRQRARPQTRLAVAASKSSPAMRQPALAPRTFGMLGIVASTGGPAALQQVAGCAADARFPLPILLVQHIPAGFLDGFASWLGTVCPLRGGRLPATARRRGPARSICRRPTGTCAWIRTACAWTPGGPVSSQRPSGTVLFQSLARSLGPSALGVLLTGMGDDGAEGLKELRDAGGYTIAEDESTAVVYGMPAVAVRLGAVCESLPLRRNRPAASSQLASRGKGGGADGRHVPHLAGRRLADPSDRARPTCSEREGWQVAWAATAQAAMEQIDQQPPDLIVLDYYLPGIRGDELCRRIRMNIDTRGIPILMLTMEGSHDAEIAWPGKRGRRLRRQVGRSRHPAAPHPHAARQERQPQASILRPVRASPAAGPAADDRRQPHVPASTWATNCGKRATRSRRAISGAAGLERLANERFDCVLVDLVMPEMNGIEVCRRINDLRRINATTPWRC